MKKTIVAVSMALAATTLQAQSNSIYGIIDTSVQSYSNGSNRFTRANDNSWYTSRLGFRGSEQLGGGLRAIYQLEGQINDSGGEMGATTRVTNEIFSREAWVGLAGSFGEFRVGRTDMSNASNLDVFSSHAGNWNQTPINGSALEAGIFQKNTIRYSTATVNGFQAIMGYSSGNNHNAINDTGGKNISTRLTYTQGAFKAGAGYHKTSAPTKAAERDMKGVSAAYDFGFVKVSALHIRGDNSSAGSVTSQASTVGVTLPLPSNMALSVALHETIEGAQTASNQGKGAIIGISKDLSKRTKLYGGYATVYNQANSAMYLNNITTAPVTPGLETKAAFAGIAHVF